MDQRIPHDIKAHILSRMESIIFNILYGITSCLRTFQSVSGFSVEVLCHVNKPHIQLHVLFAHFFGYLSEGEYHVNSATTGPETMLRFQLNVTEDVFNNILYI